MTVLAIRKPDNTSWIYSPDPGERIEPGMTLVVLGAADRVTELRKLCQ